MGSEIVWWVPVLASEPDNLSLIPQYPQVRRKEQTPEICPLTYTTTHTHTHKHYLLHTGHQALSNQSV